MLADSELVVVGRAPLKAMVRVRRGESCESPWMDVTMAVCHFEGGCCDDDAKGGSGSIGR